VAGKFAKAVVGALVGGVAAAAVVVVALHSTTPAITSAGIPITTDPPTTNAPQANCPAGNRYYYPPNGKCYQYAIPGSVGPDGTTYTCPAGDPYLNAIAKKCSSRSGSGFYADPGVSTSGSGSSGSTSGSGSSGSTSGSGGASGAPQGRHGIVGANYSCGVRSPDAGGFSVHGYVAHVTVTGPVGMWIQNTTLATMSVLTWHGYAHTRLQSDPANTLITFTDTGINYQAGATITVSFDLAYDGDLYLYPQVFQFTC
jgi:hypothetical protein